MATNCSLTTWNRGNCTLDLEALLPDGVSLRVPDGAVTTDPNHGGNFLLSIFRTDAPGAPVVQYGSGSFYDFNLGHYQAGTNSTYPLVPLTAGDYFVVVETNDGIYNCGCLDIPDWTICDHSVQFNFEGITTDALQCATLPIDPSAIDGSGNIPVDFQFSSFVIPDRFTVNYNGSQIYDSGLVAVTNDSGSFNVPYVTGVDEIEICVESDPGQPLNTSTIYSLSVGCCVVGLDPCEIPYRDPLPMFMLLSPERCGTRFSYISLPFSFVGGYWNLQTTEGADCLRTNIDEQASGGCIEAFSSVDTMLQIRHNPGVIAQTNIDCRDTGGLPATRTTTNNGNGTVSINFATQADRDIFLSTINDYEFLMAGILPASPPGYPFNMYGGRRAVVCGADGVSIGFAGWTWILGAANIVSTTEVLVDFRNIAGGDACYLENYNPTRAANQFMAAFFPAGQFSSLQIRATVDFTDPANLTLSRRWQAFGSSFSGGPLNSSDYSDWRWQPGIDFAPCEHNNPTQEYNIQFDRNDPQNTWRLFRPDGTEYLNSSDYINALSLGASGEFSTVGGAGLGGGFKDRCPGGNNVNIFGIVTKPGSSFHLQETALSGPVIGDPGCQVLDLSYYGGPTAYNWVDGPTLVADLNALPQIQAFGATLTWIRNVGLIGTDTPGAFESIPCVG